MVLEIGTNLSGVLIALVAVIPAIIAAIYARNAAKTTVATHDLVNSRMTELLAATSSTSRALGVREGEQQQRDRQSPASEGTEVWDASPPDAAERTATNTEKIAENTDPNANA